MYSRFIQHLQTKYTLYTIQNSMLLGRASLLRMQHLGQMTVYLNLLTKSYMLEEYSVTYHRLLTV